jgi:hypothetical protein
VEHMNSAIAMFVEHAQVEKALRRLREAGIDFHGVSVVGKGYQTDQNVIGYYSAGDRMKYWGQNDAFWDGILNVLSGSAFFMIPGIGPAIASGPIVGWIVDSLEHAVGTHEFSAIGRALYGIGVPAKSIAQYETSLVRGEYIMVICGTPIEVTRADKVLSASHAAETHVCITDIHAAAIAS